MWSKQFHILFFSIKDHPENLQECKENLKNKNKHKGKGEKEKDVAFAKWSVLSPLFFSTFLQKVSENPKAV